MLKTWFEIPLWQRVITALILGVLTGWAWGPEAESIKWIGDFFIKAIKMLVVPLIFFSLVSGVAAIGDLRKLGAVGGRAMLLFVVTGQIAVWMGLGLGTLVQPGAGLDTSVIQKGATPEPNETTAVDMVLSIVPESPVQVMADVAVLPLIVFSLLIGIGILMAKEDGLPVQKVFDSGAVIMQKVTMIVMELTPFGVFALMAWVAGTLGLDALVSLAKLVGLNYLGCLLIIALIYGSMIKFLARLPVRDFFRGIVDAMAVSYSTASSNATLPVTLRCADGWHGWQSQAPFDGIIVAASPPEIPKDLLSQLGDGGRDRLGGVEAAIFRARGVALVHGGAGVDQDPDGDRAFTLGLAHKEFVGPGIKLPVDLAQFVARFIGAILRELEASAPAVALVQADAMRSHRPARDEAQAAKPAAHVRGEEIDHGRIRRAERRGPARRPHRRRRAPRPPRRRTEAGDGA